MEIRARRWLIGMLLISAFAGNLLAQPGDYMFRLGFLRAGEDMNPVDIHYLGRNRETGLDEFLVLLVRGIGEGGTSQPTNDPIYFVHFAYGGTPPTLMLLNIRTFRPRIAGDIGTPPIPRFARLIHQPSITWHDRIEEGYWYLIIWPGFVYRLKDNFYKAPADPAVIIDGRYYSIANRGPAFSRGTHLGVVWRPRGILSTPSVSSMLITQPYSAGYLAIDRNGDVLGSWTHRIPEIVCEEPPCQTCDLPSLAFRAVDFYPFGGFSNVTGLTPLSGNAVDEYAAVLIAYVDQQGCEYVSCPAIPVVIRFGLDGRIRWAKAYRMFRPNGSPGTSIIHSPFWIVEDRAAPTTTPNRLLFATGYKTSHLWRVDRETGNPIWGYHENNDLRTIFGECISPHPRGGWIIAGDIGAYIAHTTDAGFYYSGEIVRVPGTQCWDIGDKYFLGTIGGNYILSIDESNHAVTSDCSEWVFLPVIRFKPLGQNNACNPPIEPPRFERTRICSVNVVASLTPVQGVGFQRATADITEGRLPLVVECSTTFDLCLGDTHCRNGIRWSDGDVAPYPDNPSSADLEAFGDCCIDDADLLQVLFNFGSVYDYSDPGQFKPGRGDVDCNGIVDDADLLIVLSNFQRGCR